MEKTELGKLRDYYEIYKYFIEVFKFCCYIWLGLVIIVSISMKSLINNYCYIFGAMFILFSIFGKLIVYFIQKYEKDHEIELTKLRINEIKQELGEMEERRTKLQLKYSEKLDTIIN